MWMVRVSLVLLCSGLVGFAPQQAGSAPLDPAREERVQKLGKELRCAVCQGMSIADSPASMARAQLDKVRSLVVDGKSDQEIRGYFVARYGEWVLLQPQAHGINWMVWLAPAALLLIGFGVIFRQIRKRPARSTAQPAASIPQGPAAKGAEDEYVARIRRELEH